MFPVERLYFSLLSNFIFGYNFVFAFWILQMEILNHKMHVFVVGFQAEINIVFDKR